MCTTRGAAHPTTTPGPGPAIASLATAAIILASSPVEAGTRPVGAAQQGDPARSARVARVAEPPSGGYTFLGDLESWEPAPGGARLTCGGAELDLTFLEPGVLRVTLHREGRRADPLSAPLVDAEWPDADVETTETDVGVRLATEQLEVTAERDGCRLVFRDAAGRVLAEDEPGLGIGWDGDEVRNWKRIAADERFFGLGEKSGPVNRRGRQFEMWTSDIPAYGNDTDPLYQSIPFFVGVRGGAAERDAPAGPDGAADATAEPVAYGVYLNNSSRTTFNMGAGNHRYYSFAAADGLLDYFFFAGPEVARVVDAYTRLTGRPAMPPRWALGYQQSRWSYTPASEVLEIARGFRERSIPADAIYLDIHYMDGYRVFTWDPERFPEPRALLGELDALGFKAVTIVDPGVKVDSAFRVASEGLAGDHFVRYPDGEIYVGSVWPGRSYFPDFARAATRDWWADEIAAFASAGVRGIWNDMNEPAVWGKAFPDEALMETAGGPRSMKRMRNLYAFHMTRAAWDGLRRLRPDERPFLLTRAGFAGEQRWTAVWTGDNVASWDHLALGIRMMVGLGLSGVPFVGTDVGGFVGSPTPELFARWIQVGVFSPLFRTHTEFDSRRQEPWSFGPQVETIARDAIELRYRLLPYLYTLFREAQETGAPLLRPMFWHFPADSAAWNSRWEHQFLVGDRLLVAPVVHEGQRHQDVRLPAGRWTDLATGRVHEGDRVAVLEAPLGRIPILLGEGGILPMGEPMDHVGAPHDPDLTLDVLPGPRPGRFTLYEDDGLSWDFEDGGYRTTRFEVSQRPGGQTPELRFTRVVEHDGFQVPGRPLTVRFFGRDEPPRDVTLDGRDVREGAPAAAANAPAAGTTWWAYDGERGVLSVRFAEQGKQQEVRVR